MAIEGLTSLLSTLNNFTDEEKLKAKMNKCTLMVERDAKLKCPRGDNGTLRSSIYSEVTEEDGDIVGIVGSTLQYAPYVEYGTGLYADGGLGRKDVPWCYQDAKGEWWYTSGQNPQPFLNPALEENRDNILKNLGGENNG